MLESGQVLRVRPSVSETFSKEIGSLEENSYQLLEKLGQHAGRQTWVAMDLGKQPAQRVIIKLLAFSPQMQWDDFKLFEREAQVLKNLNNPRIPRYRHSFTLNKHIGDGLCWFGLVQDCIPGVSLQQLLNQGKRFTEAQVRSYATEILNILIYLHELSPPVLHRDIKPSNLILAQSDTQDVLGESDTQDVLGKSDTQDVLSESDTHDVLSESDIQDVLAESDIQDVLSESDTQDACPTQIYLVDFGAVQNQAAIEGVTFTVVGTSGYTPWEQFWGRAVPASDLYALGATLIHLLTGTPPTDLPQQNLRIQFSDKVSLECNFVRWIEKLTEPDIDQRFRTARQALEALQTGREVKSLIPDIPQPLGSRVRIKKSTNQLAVKLPRRGTSLLGSMKFGAKLMWTASLVGFLSFQGATIFRVLEFPAFMLLLVLLCGGFSIPAGKALVRVLANLKEELVASFRQENIYLDKDCFVIEKQLFGWNYLRQMGQIADIKNVKKIPFKEITILVGLATYSCGEDLTESERQWLAQEIQNWLR